MFYVKGVYIMIISEQKVSTNLASNDFKIKANSKAFKILSSNLYKYKTLAICRELICNAYDSHTQAGKKDVPVVVTAPTTINPNFSVEDFGVGLSKEEVEQIYTTYFESTKNSTNELVGGLGLGCKSPFAYTTSFTVIATKDQIRNTFVAFIGDGGTPQITLLSTQSVPGTPNGVKVEVPVDPSDNYLFKDSLSKLQWFDVIPTVIGECDMVHHEAFDTLHRDGYAVTNSNRREMFAVMGNIAYPIEVENVKGAESVLNSIFGYISRYTGIYLKFNIGDLDIAPSREELSYDTNTQEEIVKKLKDTLGKIENQFNAIIDDDSTSLRDRVKILFHGNYNPHPANVLNGIKRVFTSYTQPNLEVYGKLYIDTCRWKHKVDSDVMAISTEQADTFIYQLANLAEVPNVVIVNCPIGKSVARSAKAILTAYDSTRLIELHNLSDQQREYITKIFGFDIHELEDVRSVIKSTTAKTVATPKPKHADDRIVVDGNEMYLSSKDPAKIKFVTNDSYVNFYHSLYPNATIYVVSKVYTNKIQRNGFEILDCSRNQKYTAEEFEIVLSNIAATMTKAEFERELLRTIINNSRIHLGEYAYDRPCWFGIQQLVDVYREELVAAIDIPANLQYNTVSNDNNIIYIVGGHIANKFRDSVIEKIVAITKANPALRLINNGSTQTDVNIVLDILKKGS